MKAVFSAAAAQAPLRVTVHCAGRGAPLRILDKNGEPGSLQTYTGVTQTNLIGSSPTMRLSSPAMACNPLPTAARGAIILPASIPTTDGQQIVRPACRECGRQYV